MPSEATLLAIFHIYQLKEQQPCFPRAMLAFQICPHMGTFTVAYLSDLQL